VFDKNARPDEENSVEKDVPWYQKVFDYTILFLLGAMMIIGFGIGIWGLLVNLFGNKK
jgi:hypothetical protein